MAYRFTNNAVRIGNWFEQNSLDEERQITFKNKRDRRQLFIEKTRFVFANFLKNISMEPALEHIRFGAVVQLMPIRMKVCKQNFPNFMHLTLCICMNEQVLRYSQDVNNMCEFTIAPTDRPVMRNSFRIIAADGNKDCKDPLTYGTRFRLACLQEEKTNIMYLYCGPKRADLSVLENSSVNTMKHFEINNPLGLVREKDIGPTLNMPSGYTQFFCQHIQPELRFDSIGNKILCHESIIITHVATNLNLAAEDVIIDTLFGKEYLVSVQNYKDLYNQDTWKNVWAFDNGKTETQIFF